MRDKQISEIAKIILDVDRSYYGMECDEIQAKAEANAIYDDGYRKSTDVAREIFEEIEKMLLDNHIGHYKTIVDTWCYNFNNEIISEIAELKKKYTEGNDG